MPGKESQNKHTSLETRLHNMSQVDYKVKHSNYFVIKWSLEASGRKHLAGTFFHHEKERCKLGSQYWGGGKGSGSLDLYEEKKILKKI